jgi:trans-2,3-dihydro-3-hydroxyanthranilate isomerase
VAKGELVFRKVDVFSSQPGQGNPAVVVLNGQGLTDDQMLRIAGEMKVSETAFVLPARSATADLRIRWFSPACEVNMCGHATIAAVHVLREHDLLPSVMESRSLRIETKGGLLRAMIEAMGRVNPRMIVWLNLVRPVLTPQLFEPLVWSPLLGTPQDAFTDSPPPVRTQDGDLIVFVPNVFSLNGVEPRMPALAAHCRATGIRGVCVSTANTLSPAITVQSRFFAPAVGVDEDPVTGSVHGPLAVHLVNAGVVKTYDGIAALTCTQATPAGRAGLVRALVQRQDDGYHDVRIGGECVTT